MTWSAPSERTKSIFAGAADAGHVRAARLRDLDGERTDVARRAVDQDGVAWPDRPAVAEPESLDGEDRRVREGGRVLEGHARPGSPGTPSRGRATYSAKPLVRTGRGPRRPRSPGRNRVTPGPTASTTPATSMPSRGFLRSRAGPMKRRAKLGRGSRPSRSARLTDAAWTRTSSSSSPGIGRATSSSRTTSVEP